MKFPTDIPKPPGPICGLVAIAIITGLQFEYVKNLYLRRHPKRTNWKGWTTYGTIKGMITLLGHKHALYAPPRPMQLATWMRQHARLGVTYCVLTTGHWQVVRDNTVYDQHGLHHYVNYRHRNRKVKHIMEMEEAA